MGTATKMEGARNPTTMSTTGMDTGLMSRSNTEEREDRVAEMDCRHQRGRNIGNSALAFEQEERVEKLSIRSVMYFLKHYFCV